MGELKGRVLGGYQLQEEIGGGGVAEVYRAKQATGVGREVIVKVIFKEFARQPGFARNWAYVTAASTKLASHPHILPLVAFGEENEYLYLVTPYVEAGTLADWINKGGRMGVADVAPFFQQLCGALSYAHSLGVVHGNLKPSNVYLHEGRHILLGDFGLLWDVNALDPSWSGADVAAFEYLAPEVFSGQITQAGDIYSLGATLFHSLAGHTPFHMKKLADLIAAAQQQPPPSLGQQQPPLAPAIAALDPVVAQAMAKRPEDRFASAVLVGQAIESAVRQAVTQGGLSASQPKAQPQWQAMSSTPVSAGVFNIPGALSAALPGQPPAPAIAPVFGAPPAAPGALHGMLGDLVDSSMEDGGTALGGGMPFNPAASQTLEPPTMRVPAPPTLEPPTMRIAAPPQLSPLGSNGDLLDGSAQPITAPRLRSNLADGELEAALGALPDDRYAASGLMPLDPSDALLDANVRRISQRLPAVQDPSESGTFSPTSLGLPRLTDPALKAKLPQEWQDLLTDESARHRHDPFAASSELSHAIDGRAGSSSDLLGGLSMPGAVPGHRGSAGWGAADGADPFALSAAAQPRSRRATGKAMADDFNDLSAPSRSRTAEEEFNDTMHEQKVWTRGHSIIKLGRKMSAGTLVILILVAFALVELAGFSVARPDLCVTHACAVVAGQIQKFVPNLQIPGAPAPIAFAPATISVSATTNGSGASQVTLTNTGSRAVTWSATTTLGWVSVSPTSGSLAKGAHTTITLTARPDGVSPGSYSAGLVVNAATGQSSMPISLTVTSGPVLAVKTSKVAFNSCGVSQNLDITNTGSAKLSYQATPSQADALAVSPTSGSIQPGGKATLSVTLFCSASQGQSYAVILVSDGGSAQTPVTYGP
ncbi:MAG TPA: protein kinase [Ktedonobacterales bacterium]